MPNDAEKPNDSSDIPERIANLENAVKELAAALESQAKANVSTDAAFLDHIFTTYFRSDFEAHKAAATAQADKAK